MFFFFFQAEDGIRDAQESRGLGDVYKRQVDKIAHRPLDYPKIWRLAQARASRPVKFGTCCSQVMGLFLDIHTPKYTCLLYTSDAADERSSVDLGGRRIIKKKKKK